MAKIHILQSFGSLKLSIPYLFLLVMLTIISVVSRFVLDLNPLILQHQEFDVFVVGSILFLGFVINRIAPKTAIPSFVWVIFAGMAMQPMLESFTGEVELLKVVMEVFAALILFYGGMEIPFKNFQRWFFPIATLSVIGVALSAILFSLVLYALAIAIGIFDATLLPSIIILSVALASTDPTALIPVLDKLNFKRDYIKDIAISESALTDISGSILTRFLLLAFLTIIVGSQNPFEYFAPLIQKDTYDAFALQIMTGVFVGWLGYSLINSLYKHRYSGQDHTDPALLLAVPIFTFSLGNVLGGAGFLAAFIAGLMSESSRPIKEASEFYDHILEHLIHPFIFIILGALIPLSLFLEYAPLGLLSGFAFMFIIRPIVVFISLFPWLYKGEFKFADLVFFSFIRETGIIAAVLLVIASSFHVIESEFVIAIGMWIILITLVVEPPLTPWFARKVGVAE
jgi:cell volume regulation protein A